MRTIVSSENNRFVSLDPKSIELAKSIKRQSPMLPFETTESGILFEQYTVGSIMLGDILITVECRNKSFSLNKVLEMLLYIEGVKADLTSTFLNVANAGISGLTILPYIFCDSVSKLLAKDLTGDFIGSISSGNIIKGSLILKDFSPLKIPLGQLSFNQHIYTIDVPQNQIIKAALKKCLLLADRYSEPLIKTHLKRFEGVSDNFLINDQVLAQLRRIKSYNEQYSECVHLALLILENVALSTSHGDIKWFAFLANSNDLFEKFVRRVISNNIDQKIEKWESPKKYASSYINGEISYKSFSPDILVEYSPSNQTALAVLDAKNKFFNPASQGIGTLIQSSDIYELLFYMRQLKTKIGGLVYPASQRFEPIKINAIDGDDINIAAISVNLSATIEQIEKDLHKDVSKSVLKYM